MARTFPVFALGFLAGAVLMLLAAPLLNPEGPKVEVAAVSSTYDSPTPAVSTDAASGVYVRPGSQAR